MSIPRNYFHRSIVNSETVFSIVAFSIQRTYFHPYYGQFQDRIFISGVIHSETVFSSVVLPIQRPYFNSSIIHSETVFSSVLQYCQFRDHIISCVILPIYNAGEDCISLSFTANTYYTLSIFSFSGYDSPKNLIKYISTVSLYYCTLRDCLHCCVPYCLHCWVPYCLHCGGLSSLYCTVIISWWSY